MTAHHVRRTLLAIVVAGALVGLLPGTSVASSATGPPVRVSGASPFADCQPAADDANLPAGEIEPFVDVNPTNPDNVVAVWAQDRFRGLVAAVSFDRGRTWERGVIRGLGRCTGGTFDYVDDAWLSFGPDGVLHLYGKVFDAGQSRSGAFAVRSTDGGQTWSDPVPLVMETRPQKGNYSGGAITADPTDPDLVYAVVPKFAKPDADGEPYRGEVAFTRSRDGGESWRPARKILDTGKNRMSTGHQIVVLPDGTLLDVFTLMDFRDSPRRPETRVSMMRSSNQGRSWSRPTPIARLGSVGVTDPETGDQVNGASTLLVDAAVDQASGRIYVVWQDARWSDGQADAIALSSSPDGGRTWTTPTKVNATPTDIPIGNQQAFTARVDVATGGAVAVTYADFRRNDKGAALWTDRWLVRCRPTAMAPCATVKASTAESRLTETSFDMRKAPKLTDPRLGFYLGDYMGLANSGRGFATVFVRPHDDDPASVFARSVGPTPSLAR